MLFSEAAEEPQNPRHLPPSLSTSILRVAALRSPHLARHLRAERLGHRNQQCSPFPTRSHNKLSP